MAAASKHSQLHVRDVQSITPSTNAPPEGRRAHERNGREEWARKRDWHIRHQRLGPLEEYEVERVDCTIEQDDAGSRGQTDDRCERQEKRIFIDAKLRKARKKRIPTRACGSRERARSNASLNAYPAAVWRWPALHYASPRAAMIITIVFVSKPSISTRI